MALCIKELLSEADVTKLLKGDFQFSTLVSLYRKLSGDDNKKISQSNSSFIDILVNSDLMISPFNDAAHKFTTVKESVSDILLQKISIGLIAVDKIPLKRIVTDVLHMNSYFISDALIAKVCSGDARFKVANSSNGLVVSRVQGDIVKTLETSDVSNAEREKARSSLVKYLYKSQPALVKAIQKDVQYKDILAIFKFWTNLDRKDGDFLKWLAGLASVNCKEEIYIYQRNLSSVLMDRIGMVVGDACRTIDEIVDIVCVGKPELITRNTVFQLIGTHRGSLRITPESQHNSIGQKQVVSMKGPSENAAHSNDDRCDVDSNDNGHEVPSSKKDSVHNKTIIVTGSAENLSDDIKLPDSCERRVLPLLTVKVRFEQIIAGYRFVRSSTDVNCLIETHGCFLDYLIEKARVCKPNKFPHKEFVKHVRVITVKFLHKIVKRQKPSFDELIEVSLKKLSHGLVNEKFLKRSLDLVEPEALCVSSFPTRKNDSSTRRGDNIELRDTSGAQVVACDTQQGDALADLESPRVLHLLTRNPRYIDVYDVFSSLPKESVDILAKNSMSFFEWLIALCRKLMPYDAQNLQTHLQELVQSQVAKLHSKEHCQMTIQHVHSVLCSDEPMLISPNFLSWCLEQPGSSFCVFQSWVYLRNVQNDNDESSAIEAVLVNASSRTSVDMNEFVKSAPDMQTICTVARKISRLPTEYSRDLSLKGLCWYEFIENMLNSRRERTNWHVLLKAECWKLLGSSVQRLGDLFSRICNGVANFITIDILEESLRRHPDQFALSNSSGVSCCIARVRDVNGGEVKCVDGREDKFLGKILFYFPSSGSSDIFTILELINKEDSAIHKGNQKVDVSFLQCFFKAFPMLFYLRGQVAVLTCMALDLKLKYMDALYPTSTTENEEAGCRRSSRRKSKSERPSRSKKRRFSSHESTIRQDEIIVISESEKDDNSVHSGEYASLLVEENASVRDDIADTINNFLPGLVTDITLSLLQDNGGTYPGVPLMQELLPKILDPDEASQVVSSTKYWSRFKSKITSILMDDPKFKTVMCGNDETTLNEVLIASREENQPAGGKSRGDAQVGEISSTSISLADETLTLDEEGDPGADVDGTPLDDVIMLSPSHATSQYDSGMERRISEDMNRLDNDNSIGTSCHLDDVSPSEAVDKNRVELVASKQRSHSAVHPCESVKVTPKFPSYSTWSTASTAYRYLRDAPAKQNDKLEKAERDELLNGFIREYLSLKAGSCHTELLIADAHRRIGGDRFARSRLVFEAYVLQFIMDNADSFIFSGTDCAIGVTKVSLRYAQTPPPVESVNKILMSFCNDLWPSCVAYLNTKSKTQSNIDELCQHITETKRPQLNFIPDTEVTYAVRCMCLVTMITNLKLFCFTVNDHVVYLRPQKENESQGSRREKQASRIHAELKPVLKNPQLRDAVLLLADIIKKANPSSQKKIRELWQAEAPANLSKIFGTGVSFTIALRKYANLFPPSANGVITINHDALNFIKAS